MAEKQYSCPVCGYNSDNEEDVKNHMAEMADDPKHQEYDLKQQEEEQEKSRKKGIIRTAFASDIYCPALTLLLWIIDVAWIMLGHAEKDCTPRS